MPTIEIPRFEIHKIEIHKIPIWKTDVLILDKIHKPIVDIPACVRVHRNNLTSLIDNDKDQYGTYTECGNFSIPSYEPLEYNPSKLIKGPDGQMYDENFINTIPGGFSNMEEIERRRKIFEGMP